jgi:hypothetical protein
VASLGSPWGPNKDRGVLKLSDGGKTWRNVLFINDLTGAADMVVDPSNPNKLYVAMWEHKRDPWYFNSGGKGSGLYITYDGGDNFIKVTQKMDFPKAIWVELALPAQPTNQILCMPWLRLKKTDCISQQTEEKNGHWFLQKYRGETILLF